MAKKNAQMVDSRWKGGKIVASSAARRSEPEMEKGSKIVVNSAAKGNKPGP